MGHPQLGGLAGLAGGGLGSGLGAQQAQSGQFGQSQQHGLDALRYQMEASRAARARVDEISMKRAMLRTRAEDPVKYAEMVSQQDTPAGIHFKPDGTIDRVDSSSWIVPGVKPKRSHKIDYDKPLATELQHWADDWLKM